MTFDVERALGRGFLARLVDEVQAAGEVALALARAGATSRFETKPDRSPVTEADKAVEARLRAFLAEHAPTAGFLGEESGESERGGELRFVVDPIDGTRAFLRGIPTWSILVGLEAKGEPVLGVVLMPAAGDLFVGVQGQGATMNGAALRVSAVRHLADAAVSHGALSQFAEGQCLPMLGRLAAGTYTQRGFSDFDGYRQLLLGRVDAMIDPAVKAWDLCAAAAIVREAGGELTSLSGERTIHGGGAVASNGAIHAELLKLLGP